MNRSSKKRRTRKQDQLPSQQPEKPLRKSALSESNWPHSQQTSRMNEEEDEEGEEAEEEGIQEPATGAGRRVTFGPTVLTARNMI